MYLRDIMRNLIVNGCGFPREKKALIRARNLTNSKEDQYNKRSSFEGQIIIIISNDIYLKNTY